MLVTFSCNKKISHTNCVLTCESGSHVPNLLNGKRDFFLAALFADNFFFVIISHFVSFQFVSSHLTLRHFISFHFIPFNLILFNFIKFYFIKFYFILIFLPYVI